MITILYGEYTTMLVDRNMPDKTSTKTFLLNFFGGGKVLENGSKEQRRDALLQDAAAFAMGAVTCSVLLASLLACSVTCCNVSAQRQVARLRVLFFTAVIRQNMAWFDTRETSAFASRITEDVERIQEGIGEKLGMFVFHTSSFLLQVTVAFLYGWLLALVVTTCSPFIVISSLALARKHSKMAVQQQEITTSAGGAAEEALSNMRTVMAFAGEEKEAKRYADKLRIAEKLAQRRGIFSGIGGAIMWFILFSSYGLAFWYGVTLIVRSREDGTNTYTPTVLIVVLFGILWGSMHLGFTGPHIEAFATACASAAGVFAVIERQSPIDPLSTVHGHIPPQPPTGSLKLRGVEFRYPSRPEVQVLRGIDLDVGSGETVALVGSSGSGKSTIVQLVQRFYDPYFGQVMLDDDNIRDLNVSWLRSHMGVVGQEPVLFSGTIAENIRYGRYDASQEEIEAAARKAFADPFIKRLPEGYNTLMGERGAQLSGGQKQRVAIARALVRNPRILLLDEATSALDLRSEALVQNALDQAAKNRTTLVVAQRLSTIRNADRIAVFSDGRIEELGTHDELMEREGIYYSLVTADETREQEENLDVELAAALAQPEEVDLGDNLGKDTSASILSDLIFASKPTKDLYDTPRRARRLRRVMELNRPEWRYILVGCIASIFVGAAMPSFAVILGDIYKSLSEGPRAALEKSTIYSLLFLGLGVMVGLGTFLQIYMFCFAGARLTTRLRNQTFQALMRQEAAFFDDPRNGVGILCMRLSGDAAAVQGATGIRIGFIIQACTTLALGVGLSVYYSWKLTLVTLLGVPIVFLAVFLEARLTEAQKNQEKMALENATKLAVEVIANIRTVASLGGERLFLHVYERELTKALAAARRKMRYRGIVYGLGQSSWMIAYALAFSVGGTFVANDGMPYENVLKVSESLLFGAYLLGHTLSVAPDMGAAKIAAVRILELLDRQPQLKSPQNPLPVPDKVEGRVEYKDVTFTYPTRPGVRVLKGLRMKVTPGTTVALVGSSGCGKSTCLQLLQRFYDPDEGSVLIEGLPTTQVPLDWLREQLSIVSQEPVLFDRTIAQNIAYGDNNREVTNEEIIQAAMAANIHTFVSSLPEGYETRLGTKGTQLSGGQKQRIAIARALVRNPRILLLDEATSALDSQSEKIVQKALDKAQQGRTCIIVAHRLGTIRNASHIYVFKKGKIVEEGKHTQLMAKKGLYYHLQLKDYTTEND